MRPIEGQIDVSGARLVSTRRVPEAAFQKGGLPWGLWVNPLAKGRVSERRIASLWWGRVPRPTLVIIGEVESELNSLQGSIGHYGDSFE